MSKALCSIKNEQEKKITIKRRIAGKTMGLGYWGAIDASRKIKVETSNALDNEGEEGIDE